MFARFEDHIVDIVSHNNLDRLIVSLGNRLRLPEWGQFTILQTRTLMKQLDR